MDAARNSLELTILMPCLNEAETIETCVTKALGFLRSRGISGEVLIADNGSTDGSQEMAMRLGARVVPIPRRGYGAALIGGIDAACGRYVIMGDADDSYDFTALDPFLEKLREGCELVMGNRFLGGIRPNAMPPLHRYLGNPVLTGIGRILFNSPAGDFHCGLRGFSADAMRRLGLTCTGMEFASEMVVKSTLHKLKITEVPTTLSKDGRSRPPHLRSWRDGWRHLRFLLLFSPSWLFYYPGLLLLVLGVGAMTWLVPGNRMLGSVQLGVNTLSFAAAAIICGFQATSFFMFAHLHAERAGLLPPEPLVRRLAAALRLEVGLIVGGLAFVIGLSLALYAVGAWGGQAYGDLNPEQSLRIVIPSATLLILGLQIILTSCMLGILQLESPARDSSAGSGR